MEIKIMNAHCKPKISKMLAPNFLATLAVVGSPIRISHHPSKTLGCHVSGSEEDLILENVEQIGWRSWDAQLTCPWRMGWGFDPLTVAVHRSAALPGHSFCTSASLLSKSYLWSCHFNNFLENIPYLIVFSMDLHGSPIGMLRLHLSCEGDANVPIGTVCGRILCTLASKWSDANMWNQFDVLYETRLMIFQQESPRCSISQIL